MIARSFRGKHRKCCVRGERGHRRTPDIPTFSVMQCHRICPSAGTKLSGANAYGRARQSSLSGQPVLSSPEGFLGVARQALDKLGVEWEPTDAQRAYNEGRSTQVPVNPVVRVKGRFSRHLRYRNAELVLER